MIIGERSVRLVENTGGVYAHAPIFFRISPDISVDTLAAIEIEHAAVCGEAIAIEVHERDGYRRLGLLTPSEVSRAWRVDRLPIRAPTPSTTAESADGTAVSPEAAEAATPSVLDNVYIDRSSADPSQQTTRDKWVTAEAQFLEIRSCNADNLEHQHVFRLGDSIVFKIAIELHVDVPICWLAGIIFDERGNRVHLGVHHFDQGLNAGTSEVLFQLDQLNLRQGEYVGSFELLPLFDYNWPHSQRIPYLCHWDRCVYFKIDEDYHGSIPLGVVALPLRVKTRQLRDATDHEIITTVSVPGEARPAINL